MSFCEFSILLAASSDKELSIGCLIYNKFNILAYRIRNILLVFSGLNPLFL